MRSVLLVGFGVLTYIILAAVSLAVPILMAIALFKYITG